MKESASFRFLVIGLLIALSVVVFIAQVNHEETKCPEVSLAPLQNNVKSLENTISSLEKQMKQMESKLKEEKKVEPKFEAKPELVFKELVNIQQNSVQFSFIIVLTMEELQSLALPNHLKVIVGSQSMCSPRIGQTCEWILVIPSQSSLPETITSITSPQSTVHWVSMPKTDIKLNPHNYGAVKAKGNYLIFLPSITSISDWSLDITALEKLFTSNPDIGAVGALIMKNAEIVQNYGISIAEGSPEQPSAFYIGEGLTLHHPSLQRTPVAGLSKLGLAVPRPLFYDLGGWDSQYADSELFQDLDFSLRIIQSHKSLYQLFSWKLYSFNSTKIPRKSNIPTEWTFRASEAFWKKWGNFLEKEEIISKPKMDLKVIWDLYCGCTGLNIEAIHFLIPLEERVRIGAVAGSDCFCQGFPESTTEALKRIRSRTLEDIDVFISHKPADKYPSFPYRGIVTIPKRPKYVIGRSMSETDSIPKQWVDNINNLVDEVWVPTKWHKRVFSEAGANIEKIYVVPEPTDPYFWNPTTTVSLPVKGKSEKDYNFFSVFKWEPRKGTEFLLEAFVLEFKNTDAVTLWLQTYLYGEADPHNQKRIEDKVESVLEKIVEKHSLDIDSLPRIEVLSKELVSGDMPRLYKNFDCFVLATRGEGWGLPIIEAMAMELPVIATNWSGPTEFLTPENSFAVSAVAEPVRKGSKENWATPSIEDLRKHMRFAFENREQAKEKGRQARIDVINKYSEEKVADVVQKRLEAIQKQFL